jgi:hypothetical protein
MAHETEFGLKVTSRDASPSAITSVVCRFCVAFGREEKVGQKRKTIATKKYFKAPFRPVLYRQHHESQHPSKWLSYSEASDATKASFFDVVPVGNQLTSHFEGSDGQLYFTIDPEIVDVLISEVFFNPEDGEESVARATSVFKRQDGTAAYCVQIKQIKMFRLVINYVGFGASFSMVSRQVAAAREELKLGYLSGCNETKVSAFVRVALAANMQTLKSLLAGCWVFSIAFDSATVGSTPLFDIRVRFAVKGCLFCFHLIAMPLIGRHTGPNMFDAFVKVADVVMPHWRNTLFSVSSDGARNMTGRDRGIVSRIGEAISPNHTLLRTWCGLERKT